MTGLLAGVLSLGAGRDDWLYLSPSLSPMAPQGLPELLRSVQHLLHAQNTSAPRWLQAGMQLMGTTVQGPWR